MFNKNTYIGVLFLLLSTFTMNAANLLVHKYTEEEGLPGSVVYSVSQDNKGYMFFTTRNGLARYDGINWKTEWNTFPRTQADRANFLKDENNDLWIYSPNTPNGFYKYENNNWSLKTTVPVGYIPYRLINYSPAAISTIQNDLKILLYVDRIGLIFFNKNRWNEIKLDSNRFEVYHIINNKGAFYLATSNGIKVLDQFNYSLKNLDSKIPNTAFYSIEIESINNSPSKIWMLGKGFLSYYDFKDYNVFLTAKELELYSNNERVSILPDYYGTILVGSLFRLYQINKNSLRINQLGIRNGLNDNSAREIFLDREKNIWITNDRGVCKIPSMRFINYNQYSGLLEDEVTSILQVNNKHYLGHNYGVSIAYTKDEIKHIKLNSANRSTRVLDMNVSPFGEVYIATNAQGLFKITKDDQLVKVPTGKEFEAIQSAIFDKNGTLYIASFSTILSKSIYEQNFKVVTKFNFPIRKLFIDKDNMLWAASQGGGVLKIQNNGVKSFNSSQFGINSVYAINFDLQDTVLVGTASGLCFISGDSLKRYSINGNTLEKPIFFIKKYFEAFWLGTDAGVFKWKNGILNQYGVKEGLSGLETNRDACYLDNQNFLWIGTNRGLTRYNYEFDEKKPAKPFVYLKSITYNDQKFDVHSLKINIPGNHRNIYFGIDVLAFDDEKGNKIQYKMEGFDQDWSKINNFNNFELLYRQLPPGNYRLKIRVANAFGVWSDEISSPEIIVEQPFYWSLPFIVFVLFVVAGIGYFVINYISEKKYKSKLESEVVLRTRQLAESELRYKQMFVDNNAYMIIYDGENGKIIDANPSALDYFGFESQELSNISIFDLISENIENEPLFLKELVSSKVFVCKHKSSDDLIRDGIIHQSKININDKSFVYAIIEDITERKIAEDKLLTLNSELEDIVKKRTNDLENALDELKTEVQIRKKTEQELFDTNEKLIASLAKEKELGELKSRFISMISHEYRTPLTVILSSAYLVKESLKRGLEDEIDRHLYKIHASVTAMSRLLEDVLTYGKAEEGALTVRLSTFSIADFIKETIEEVKAVDQSKHDLVFTYTDDAKLISDRYLLRQILINIMLNSIKFSEKETKVNIELKVFKKDFAVIIKDEGKGISDEDLAQIFTPFFRNEKTIGIIPGTGLGLAIVKRCVDILKGSIKVNNKVENGVVFTVTLPINHPEEPSQTI